MKVLPTTNDSNNGAAILAQSKKDLINALTYYLNAEDYIEKNSPEDALVYIDPKKWPNLDVLKQKLTALQTSLNNDTAITFTYDTNSTYRVKDSNSTTIGQMVIVWDLTGHHYGKPGSLTLTNGAPPSWMIDDSSIDDSFNFGADLSDDLGDWGYLQGTYNNNNGSITDVTLYWWGYNNNGSLEQLSCQLVSSTPSNITVNLNPIFGSTKYPNPVNPRDLLPAFDADNGPISCTFGHGLNNDATLGGILPDMNQQDWSNIYGLSDCGNINCPSADVASAQGAGIGDCLVNIYDLAALASHWLDACTQPSWCGNVDFDRNGSIDFADFAKLADEWLQQGGP